MSLTLSLLVGFPGVGEARSKHGGHTSHAKTKTSSSEKEGSGHAKHPLPVPGEIVKEQVAVAVELLDRERTESLFEVNVARHGVQPLSIRIRNGSGQTYQFRKANLDQPVIPAVDVARYAYPNPLITGVRLLKWGVLVIPVHIAQFFISMLPIVDFSAEEANPWPVMNQQIRRDFQQGEIPDQDIVPNASLDGFTFVRGLSHGSLLRLKLVNRQTQQPLEFELHL